MLLGHFVNSVILVFCWTISVFCWAMTVFCCSMAVFCWAMALEDNPTTDEKLQYHQQLIDQVAKSLRSLDLIIQIAALEDSFRKEISKRMQLTTDVEILMGNRFFQNFNVSSKLHSLRDFLFGMNLLTQLFE